MSIPTRWRRSAVTLSMMALMGLTLSATGAAHADEFTTGNTAPTVTTQGLSPTIQPDTGASEAVYEYSVLVGDAESLNDLNTVTVCLYLTTGGDSTCATPDPTTDVSMTWTQSTNAFTIANGSGTYWALGTDPISTSPTLTGVSGTFTFTFTVSEAMREGSWTAAVTATDKSAATATGSAATTTVNHYSSITTRTALDFGIVTAGLTGSTLTSSPTVTSNGQTTYNASATNFTAGAYTFTLKTDGATSVAPAAGQVTFDCQVASSFTEASAKRVGLTSTLLDATQTSTGTPESGSAVAHTCRLAHGGERPVGAYSGTIVTAIGNG